jgi:hypothetical protein
MTDPNPTRIEHLFIVRLWSEESSSSLPVWRGSVEHITCKQKLYFVRLVDMQDFITFHLCERSLPAGKDDTPELNFDPEQEV